MKGQLMPLNERAIDVPQWHLLNYCVLVYFAFTPEMKYWIALAEEFYSLRQVNLSAKASYHISVYRFLLWISHVMSLINIRQKFWYVYFQQFYFNTNPQYCSIKLFISLKQCSNIGENSLEWTHHIFLFIWFKFCSWSIDPVIFKGSYTLDLN